MTWRIVEGDCVERMTAMEPCSVDAVVCDPPYGLEFMGKNWDAPWREGGNTDATVRDPATERGGFQDGNGGNPYSRSRIEYGRGNRGESRAFQAWCEAWSCEALRVLKPGGHLLAFGGTRTYHRLACAIEDAGFEIRDTIAWLYGSGFPKSLDVSKAIDAAAGATRERVPATGGLHANRNLNDDGWRNIGAAEPLQASSAPATPDAERWQGWGTALKPAHEPIVVARKPLSGTVAANVLAHGTGALNVDGCRIDTDWSSDPTRRGWQGTRRPDDGFVPDSGGELPHAARSHTPDTAPGRWPANVILDSEAAAMLDESVAPSVSRQGKPRTGSNGDGWGMTATGAEYDDAGGPSRYFYCAKASSAERNAGLDGFEAQGVHRYGAGIGEGIDPNAPSMDRNVHPTVKPVDLMRWLVRLVTPPDGLVLDPFAGSGTTGCAAVLEGFRFVGIEREPEYAAIARARIAWWAEHPDGMELVQRLEHEKQRKAKADAGQLGLFG